MISAAKNGRADDNTELVAEGANIDYKDRVRRLAWVSMFHLLSDHDVLH